MNHHMGWGGSWTEEKLRVLRGYLGAYVTALKNQAFRLEYIDAFAGAGYRRRKGSDTAQLALTDEPVEEYRDGAARIALGLNQGFDAYYFIERRASHVEELRGLANEHSAQEIHIHQGDANVWLRELCERDWQRRRAVVFLDPYGMQVEWGTMETLARTKAMDVWVLVPIAVAVNRLLMRDYASIPEGWRRRLDLFFGSEEWRNRLYETPDEKARRTGAPLLLLDVGPSSGLATKAASLDDIAAYYAERLRACFPYVAGFRYLCHPNGKPLYALYFASANPSPKAGAISVSIAGHLLRS